MKNLEILKTRKEEIIEKTLELMPTAIGGNHGMFSADLYFFFKVNEETEELTVDYFPAVGNISTSDNTFFDIPGHEMPDPSEYGYETVEDMDFDACGYREFIEGWINQHIHNLENTFE